MIQVFLLFRSRCFHNQVGDIEVTASPEQVEQTENNQGGVAHNDTRDTGADPKKEPRHQQCGQVLRHGYRFSAVTVWIHTLPRHTGLNGFEMVLRENREA